MRRLVGSLVQIAAVTLLALGALPVSVSAQGGAVMRKAPELAFTLPGEGDKLLSQYRGKVLALEFILTTCPHCQQASRTMTRYQQQYGARGFQALDLAINALDDGRKPEQASLLTESFANNFQVGFPVGFIGRDPMMSFMGFSIMDRMVVPQLVLIDRKGNVRYQTPASDANDDYGKMMNEKAIEQHIEELVNEPASSAGRRVAVRKRS